MEAIIALIWNIIDSLVQFGIMLCLVRIAYVIEDALPA